MSPFFQPLIRPHDQGHWYLAEVYSFCHRARECGYRMLVDTTIGIEHVGDYPCIWEVLSEITLD